MRMSLTVRSVLSVLVALFLTSIVSTPAGAAAKARPPEIEAFTADPANQFEPGTEITFVVEGTAKGKAVVRISGISRTISLPEVEAGIYEGSYTIRSRDKVGPSTTARASLTRSGRKIGRAHV